MPPKKKTTTKAPVKGDSPPPTRTRGRPADKSSAKSPEPVKKVKRDQSPEPSKAAVKKTKSNDLSAEKKGETAKEPVKEEMKKVVMKGSIPVDQYLSNGSNYKVYTDGSKVYAATLNQSNVQANNNKFYILQILQHESIANNYIFFTRWGRVGVPGQQAPIFCSSPAQAITMYNKKLREKSSPSGGYR